MAELAKATTTEPTGEPGRRTALLDEQWCIGPKMHGGYLLALLAQAAVDELADGTGPDDGSRAGAAHDVPEAVTGTFLRAPDPGPAVVTVDVLRRGRGATQVRARLDQDDRPCVEIALVLGAVPAPGPHEGDISPAPVALPPFERCERRPVDTPDGRGGLPLMEVVDTRLAPDSLGFLSGRPTGEGRLSGWAELDTREPWSPVGLLVALDVLPPASFDLGLTGWSPTMSLTAHVHAVPAPGPLRLTQWVDHLAGERMHESCRVWDTDGRMVGQATQLAAVRR
ncbi:thioesterase family protein [Actinomycetospora sp. TBRC 11914]|uniref:thioesterase family protein n=1 Tax=Actinomycetospora sp. TBRC 11914 TaxID=2729387 RepID=UPI00145E9042|nr:thioesterase family protein [Actinomycetospora sp. TBRC 11914]NMO90175.1 thioesterase family protein [Actinomycetospora sp. TBRC 11914]